MENVLLITDELRVGGGETYFYKIENLIERKAFNLFTAAEMGEFYHKIKYKDNFYNLSKNRIKKIIQLGRIIKKNSIKVVHCNSFNLVILCIVVKKIYKLDFKILYTKHNLTRLEKVNKDIFVKIINNYVHKLITVCDFDKNKLQKMGINDEKLISIPNGIDINQFDFKPRYLQRNSEINIGILARLSEEKNHEFFLKVIEKLQKDDEIRFKAFIAGDGVLKEEIKNNIERSGLNIEMIGNVNNPEAFLRQMDIKMLVSKREVFPMTILEAMCVGAIVISSNVGGINDCINKETGYLINGYNEDDYVKVIKTIYNEYEKNSIIISNARKQVENNFSLKNMLNKLETLYKEEIM